MYQMEESWRWFGPQDPVTLRDIKQTGARTIVTALHHIPHGEIWTSDEIAKRKYAVEKEGFKWGVVESITVHEDIKLRTGAYRKWIENYKTSIRNVAAAGIPVITYNFMPVNDWTRTALDYEMPDGSRAMYFNWVDLAVFDVFILKRPQADASYPEKILTQAASRYRQCTSDQRQALSDVIMFGIPGEEKNTTQKMLSKLDRY